MGFGFKFSFNLSAFFGRVGGGVRNELFVEKVGNFGFVGKVGTIELNVYIACVLDWVGDSLNSFPELLRVGCT